MSFRFSILIILLFKLLFGFSQNKLDSLKAELANKKDPIDIISYQIAIGEIYEYTKPDSGAVFYKEALDLAKKIDNDTLYITALLRIGYTMELTGKADSAEHIYLSALKLLNKDTKAGLKGSVFNSLGNIYYYKSDFEKSLSNYQKALEQYESIHSELFQSYAYHNIALVHDDIGEFELALKYYKKAEATFLKYNDKSWLATCYNSLGSLYNRVDSLVLAEQYYKKSLTEYQALGDKIGMSIIYENIARCYNKREIYDMSLIYLNKALEISTETNDDYSLTSIHMGMAKTYYYKEDYDKVIQNSMISLRHARLSDFNSYFVSNYELLKNTYTKLKNYQLALQYYDSLSIAKQDIFSLEKNKAIQEMEK
jgi:tetratricopeptide (TPR) repeat protein